MVYHQDIVQTPALSVLVVFAFILLFGAVIIRAWWITWPSWITSAGASALLFQRYNIPFCYYLSLPPLTNMIPVHYCYCWPSVGHCCRIMLWSCMVGFLSWPWLWQLTTEQYTSLNSISLIGRLNSKLPSYRPRHLGDTPLLRLGQTINLSLDFLDFLARSLVISPSRQPSHHHPKHQHFLYIKTKEFKQFWAAPIMDMPVYMHQTWEGLVQTAYHLL